MDIKELLLHLKVNSSQVEYGYAFDDWELLDNAANMISQQADRIAELESNPRELSDEEIKEVIRKHWNREFGNRGMLELCRAILKKASEK